MSDLITLSEIFLSIQGESTLAGWPTAFVRVAGCPLRCAWCDTRYAYEGGEPRGLSSIVEEVQSFGVRHAAITGGEPLAQRPIIALLRELCDRGLTVSLETSGALPIDDVDERVHVVMDIKCPSSGMDARNRWENIDRLARKDEVKLVLADRGDYDYAKGLIERYRLPERCAVLLSPAWGLIEPREVVGWMLEDRLPARFQLQAHKVIWSPEARGV